MLKVTLTHDDVVAQARLSGRLDALGTPVFDRELAILPASTRSILLDCGEVEYLSSAGLRSLITLAKRLKLQQGEITLCALKPFLYRVIELAGVLRFFRLADSFEQCCADARETCQLQAEGAAESACGYNLRLAPASQAVSHAELWAGWEPERKKTEAWEYLSLEDVGLGFGLGGFGQDREHARESLGFFLSAWHATALLPSAIGTQSAPEFIATASPAESGLYVAGGLSLGGKPQLRALLTCKEPVPLDRLLHELNQALPCSEATPLRAVALLGRNLRLLDAADRQKTTAPAAFLLCLLAGNDILTLPEIPWSCLGEQRFICLAITLETLPERQEHDLQTALAATLRLEHLTGASLISPRSTLYDAQIWAFAPSTLRSGEEGRLRIELQGAAQLRDEFETIVRRIYGSGGNTAKVVLVPLHGGFSSSNFYVESFDRDGKRLIPTVLKLGNRDLIQREEDACARYVKNFVLNNSTAIMGSATQNDYAGLRYNFLGVTGQDAALTWLTRHFQTRPAKELIPLFDRIFTNILKPWYGQPKWDRIQLYRAHDPGGLFKFIERDALQELDISSDVPQLPCPELGRPLCNPFWFIKHVFPERVSRTRLWYTCITHNDLNMQNILLDERENVYIIDFSETRPNNAVADFARLEPIFLLEMTRVDAEDIGPLLRFMERWYTATSLGETPDFSYEGNDPMVAKAYALMSRLRDYADRVTLFETDLYPYLLAVFEWTARVVSYVGVPVVRKRLAAYMAGLLCERIAALDP